MEILNEKPHNFQEIINSIKAFLIKKWIGWQLDRDIKKIPSRVEKTIFYWIKKELIQEEGDYYYLTDKGRLIFFNTQERKSHFYWAKPLTTPKISTMIFFSGFLVLCWLKIVSYMFTNNLILLADGFGSIFGVLTIIIINIAPKIKYDMIIIRTEEA
ncbi:MAG: hypothetical protein ACFFAE_06295 [Candidatus Hodarchaeota archaeon]